MLTSQTLTSWNWHGKCVLFVCRSSLCVAIISVCHISFSELMKRQRTDEILKSMRQWKRTDYKAAHIQTIDPKQQPPYRKMNLKWKRTVRRVCHICLQKEGFQSLQGFQTILSWPSFGCCFVMKDRNGKDLNAGSRSAKMFCCKAIK